MKDFFDIWHMIQEFEFEGSVLALAIQRTFKSRNTPIPVESPPGLSSEFARENLPAWEAFLRGTSSGDRDLNEFQSVLADIRTFALPIMQAIRAGKPFIKSWNFTQKWT